MKKTALFLIMLALASPAMSERIVRHRNAPPALYLNSVTIPPDAETVMVSGTLAAPIDPAKTDSFDAYGDTRTQTISALSRIRKSLVALGYDMGDVVKLTAFVVGDPKLGGKIDMAGFNAGYSQYFGTADNPVFVARSTVQVAGLVGPWYLIEIEAVAAKVRDR